MCKLLVKNIDYNHSDISIDREGAYKKGDVVLVVEDSHKFGPGDLDTSVFKVIEYPGVPVSTYKHLTLSSKTYLSKIIPSSVYRKPKLLNQFIKKYRKPYRRRRFSIDLITEEITDKEKK